MAFQQARPYDTGADALGTMGDIQKLVAGQQHNRLGDLQFQLEQQKVQRANTAYQAQQTMLGQITDPKERLAWMMAPDKGAESLFRDPKTNYAATEAGVWNYSTNPPTFIPRPGRGQYRDMNNNPIGGGPGPAAQTPGANLASAGNGLDLNGFQGARRRFEGGTSGSAPPNPNSSAQGPDQFIESTWERLMLTKGRPFIDMKIGPNANLNDPKVKAAIQELRNDEEVSGAMAGAYAEENAAELQGAGIPATHRNLTVAHFLGGSGAKRFLSADPNAPAAQFVDPAALKANQSVFFDKGTGRARTVAEVLGEVDRRIGEVSGQQPAQQPGQQAAQKPGSGLEPIYNDKGELDTHFGLNRATGQVERYPTTASTQVNIGDKTGTQTLVKARADRLGVLREKGMTAIDLKPKLEMLREQLMQLKTQGPGSNTVNRAVGVVQTVARALGMDQATVKQYTEALTGMKGDDPETAAKANKIVSDLVTVGLRSAYAGLGSASNMEREGIERAQANTENPIGANLYLIDNILGPNMDRDLALWERVMPLQSDPELTNLDVEEMRFRREWNDKHKTPPPDQQPATPPATDTVQNPTVTTPPPATTPSYTPEQIQTIQTKHPDARLAPDGFYYIPDPARPGKFLQIVSP